MSAIGSLEGTLVADLFSGSGALGLEALSRGADYVIFVERSRAAVRIIQSNVELVGAQTRSAVVHADVFKYLAGSRGPFNICQSSVPGPFDFALADPPYGGKDPQRLVSRYVERPFAKELWLEHDVRAPLQLPKGAATRHYGDSGLSMISAHMLV